MRWVPWALGLAGVAQHAVMAMVDPTGYVSLDMSYLVMWLSIIGALVVCYSGCGGCYGWGDGGCGCCSEGCSCGDCGNCMPGGHKHDHEHGEHGHEGHSH